MASSSSSSSGSYVYDVFMSFREADNGQIVMPIFYDVDPSDVRKQRGDFGEAFSKQVAENTTKAELWRKQLVAASNISGWEPKNIANGHESMVIKKIVDTIFGGLFRLNSDIDEGLVGMRDRLQDLISQLEMGSSGVRMVGIWGIGGAGKTTLATSVYMKLMPHFKSHCIIDNIREESRKSGLKKLQGDILSALYKPNIEVHSVAVGKCQIKSMLCRCNVLVILDDVDDIDQLEALAGSHDWFGDGSRIYIHTRDEHLLRKHKVDHVSPVRLLADDEAIELFRSHAFNEEKHIKDYENFSLQVVSYADGLPLALKVLGSFLSDKDAKEWMSTMDRLRDIPESKIVDKLKISYDGLKDVEKELFLDIACFFREEEKSDTMELFDACGFHPEIGIKVLIQKSLITIDSYGRFDGNPIVSMPDCVRTLPRLKLLFMCDCVMLGSIELPPRTLNCLFLLRNGRHMSCIRKISFDQEMSPLDLQTNLIGLPASSIEIEGKIKIQPIAGVDDTILIGCIILQVHFQTVLQQRILFFLNWRTACKNCFGRVTSIEVKFDGLKCLKEFKCSKGPEKTPFPLPLTRSLRKLDLSGCCFEDGEIQSDIGELSNLQDLNLSYNNFSKLHFSLSQLTRLKLLNLKGCRRLLKLPELPSSIAIIIADGCDKLTSIGDLNENCKWLCYISLVESTVIDGNKLLQSMLKGNAIKNEYMHLRIRGLEIPKQFTSRLYAGGRCRLPLPENWYNDFCGFLICAVLEVHVSNRWCYPKITIKEEASDDMRGMFHDVVWGESFGGKLTWVWYVSFASLRRTEWWNPTHKNVSFYIDDNDSTSIGIGASLVPMNNGSGLTDTSTDSSEFTDYYTPKISIRDDSKSSLTISPRVYIRSLFEVSFYNKCVLF
ncbi:Toll/interleukin-1 receptor domain-containing protein [Tanacetum coccineum]